MHHYYGFDIDRLTVDADIATNLTDRHRRRHRRPTSHPVVILGYFLHFGACFLFCFFYKVEKILFCFFYKVEKTCTKISCAPKLATLTGTSTLTEVLRPCTDAHAPTSEHAPTSDHAPHSLDHPYRSPVQSILELP